MMRNLHLYTQQLLSQTVYAKSFATATKVDIEQSAKNILCFSSVKLFVSFSLLILILLGTSNAFSQAVSIWTNPITGNNPGQSDPYTTGDVKNANITVSGIGQTGVTGRNGNNTYNTRDWNTSTTFVNTDYYNWILTPASGYHVNFYSFVYTGTISSGSASWSFRSNAAGNNFATDIPTAATTGATILLTGANYQNITSATQFRLFGYNFSIGNPTYGVNDFTFNGSVLGTSVTTLMGFSSCINTAGTAQSFTINGAGLSSATALITVAGSANYEVSVTNATSGFANSVTFNALVGAVSGQTVWVRLKSNGTAGTYNGENINVSGGGFSVANNINVACSGTVINTPPTITTPTSASVTSNSAVLGGNITSTGCSNVTERGIYWSITNGFADGAGTKVSVTAGPYTTGAFTIPVSGLSQSTVYYYKAFATNSGGTVYTTQATFTTPCVPVGNPAVFGNNEWNVYTYNGTNNDLTANNYRGYYTESNLNFKTSDKWIASSTPSSAIGYQGCSVNTLMSFVSKRKGFPCGHYTISVGHDDDASLYVNGFLVPFSLSGWTYTPVLAWTGFLDENATIELRVHNTGGGDSYGELAFSFTSYLPAPPGTISGTATACDQITANWSGSSNATNYYLDVSTAGDFASFVTGYNNKDVGNVTTYNVTGLTAGTTYYYRVRASNTCGTSGNSTVITYATLPATPTAPTATTGTAAACDQITANWLASTDATKYYLDVSTASDFVSFVTGYNNKDVGSVTTYNITGLTTGTTYYYRVRANNTCGTSVNSSVITYATLPATPNAPTATAGTAATCSQITANWSASTNATKYYLDVSTVNTFASFVTGYNNKDVGNVTTLDVTGLIAGITYYYRVRASNSCGTSVNSSVITYATLPATPNAPTASAGTGATCSQITANWSASTNATMYYLDVSTASDFSSFVSGYNNLDISNVTTYNVTGLTTGTTYYYRVRASNSCGTSANSGIITYATLPNASVGSVTGTSLLCIGSLANYTANGVVLGGGTGAWSSDNTSVATVDGTGKVTGVSAGTCNIIYTITSGCGGTKSAQKSVIVQRINAVASFISGNDCPDFFGPWDANTNSYNPGVTQVVFRVTRQNSSTSWGFHYAISGATVRTASPYSSPQQQTGDISNITANYFDLVFYITNTPGSQQNVGLTITNVTDGSSCTEENSSDNDAIHIIKAMPVIGSFQ